jgi:hypothetical protein
MHEQTMNKLHKLKVDVMLNSRVDMEHLGSAEKGRVRTVDGREVGAELIVSVPKRQAAERGVVG